jgi:hypothetical protein
MPFDGRPRVTSSDCDREARIAIITGDEVGERYITLGEGDGSFTRWKLSEELARKIRRELNARLD